MGLPRVMMIYSSPCPCDPPTVDHINTDNIKHLNKFIASITGRLGPPTGIIYGLAGGRLDPHIEDTIDYLDSYLIGLGLKVPFAPVNEKDSTRISSALLTKITNNRNLEKSVDCTNTGCRQYICQSNPRHIPGIPS
jgi:hypothetical protein